MNRPIKFRAWDHNFKKMLLINDVKFVDGNMIGAKGINWDSHVTIMQFTGLLDKNGKEIYFDDFVHIIGKSSTVGDVDTIVRIEDWYNVVGEFGLEDAIEGGLTLEVIGNVWENPELLK